MAVIICLCMDYFLQQVWVGKIRVLQSMLTILMYK